jgi:predicted DNA binding CopG/RHH family protein
MEESMKTTRLPQTDSISALAEFWDTHDVTDFLDELEEVTIPVFERTSKDEAVVSILLPQEDLEILQQMARERGVEQTALLREWVREKLRAA